MSDVTPSPDDELVSAYLDGEASPPERALVDARPDLLARVTELRGIADEVGFTQPAPAGAQDAAVAAALAAFVSAPVAEPVGGVAGVTVAPVRDLATARRRRRPRTLAILSAAAAVVLVLVIGAAVLRTRSTPTTTAQVASGAAAPSTARSNAKSGDATNEASGAASNAVPLGPQADAAGGGSPPAASSNGGARYVGDLGPFADEAAIAGALRPLLPAGSSQSTGSGANAAAQPPAPQTALSEDAAQLLACATSLQQADPSLGPPVLTGRATLDGTPVDVIVVDAAPSAPAGGAHRILLVGDGCRLLASLTA